MSATATLEDTQKIIRTYQKIIQMKTYSKSNHRMFYKKSVHKYFI